MMWMQNKAISFGSTNWHAWYYVEQLSSKNLTLSLFQTNQTSIKYLLKTLVDVKEEFVSISSKEQKTDPSVFLKKFHSNFLKLNEQVNDLDIKLFKPLINTLLGFIIKITSKSVAYTDVVKEEISFSLNFIDKYLTAHLNSNTSIEEKDDKQEINLSSWI